MKKVLCLTLILCIFLCGCGKKNKENESELISGKDAKIEVINNSAVLIDVRTIDEYNTEHINGSISVPLDNIEEIEEQVPSKDKILIVYCSSGNRSKQAKEKLIDMGYKTVYDMGSMVNWYE